jgi:uncharacterized protein (TIGR03086 family)
MDLALLNEVTEGFAAYLSEVTDGDLTAPTPCARWTIHDLVEHVLESNARLGRALAPGAPAPGGPDAPVPGGPGALRETVDRESAGHVAEVLAGAGRGPAGPGRDLTGPATASGGQSPQELFEAHLASTLIHGWDLAEATQLAFDHPDPRAVDVAARFLGRIPPASRGRGRAFGEIIDFPAASPLDEVLFLSGRAPGWQARRTTRS